MSERKSPPGRITEFGFDWGCAQVSRLAHHNGHIIIGINTPKQSLTIRVTPSGLIRPEDVQKARKRSRG